MTDTIIITYAYLILINMFLIMDDQLNIKKILPYLVRNPLVLALIIPVILIYCAAKFANSELDSFILFGVLGMSALIFSAWVIKHLIANGSVE